jgi:hypothetical protein
MDFGLVLDQSASFNGIGNDTFTDYAGVLIPRFSTPLGDNGELYISAGLVAEYQNEEWAFLPELLRTELSWFYDFGNLKLGRMYYSDPLGFIAEGLFDGARFTLNTMAGSFSVGAWYTGFLYKKRANIVMTDDELEANLAKFDYNNFMDTYFAPSRAVAALDWEHPNLWGLRTRLSFLGQFDLSDGNLSSQYLTGKLTLPLNAFLFDLGGSFELMEEFGIFGIAYAAEFRAAWTLPTPFASRLSFLGRYSSGKNEEANLEAFLPLTTKSQGFVLKPKIPGVSMFSLDYAARLHRTFLLSLATCYFIRNDLGTYSGYLVGDEPSKGYLLGDEIFGRITWNPVSDVQFNIGAGVFMPSLGDVAPKAENMWRIEFGFVISLY